MKVNHIRQNVFPVLAALILSLIHIFMEDFKQRYIAARRAVIAQDLSRLNPMQRQAAMTTEGPLLLLAGAGSGKTTVLIQRVYNLLTYGRGSDSEEVPAWALSLIHILFRGRSRSPCGDTDRCGFRPRPSGA